MRLDFNSKQSGAGEGAGGGVGAGAQGCASNFGRGGPAGPYTGPLQLPSLPAPDREAQPSTSPRGQTPLFAVGPTDENSGNSNNIKPSGREAQSTSLTLGRSEGPLEGNEGGFVLLSKDPLWVAENGDFSLPFPSP